MKVTRPTPAHFGIFVFDLDTVGPGPIRRVRDFPADSERLTADAPTGVRHVLVNGLRDIGEGLWRRRRSPLQERHFDTRPAIWKIDLGSDFETIRTPGYPLFLAAMRQLGLTPNAVTLLQHLMRARPAQKPARNGERQSVHRARARVHVRRARRTPSEDRPRAISVDRAAQV